MSSLSYFSRVIADVEFRNVTVEPVLGHYRLLFHLQFGPKNWNDWYDSYIPSLTSLRAAVKLNGTSVGTALPTAEDFLPLVQPKSSNSTSIQRSFALDIDLRTLDRIERERKEQGVAFELEVIGTATVCALSSGDSSERRHSSFPPPLRLEPLLFESQLAKADIHCRISQSDWIELLHSMGYTRTLLYEIPWPAGDGDQLQRALAHFERARELFLAGNHKGAVAELRDSLDSACAEIDCEQGFPWDKVKNRESRESMQLDERFLLAWNMRSSSHAFGASWRELLTGRGTLHPRNGSASTFPCGVYAGFAAASRRIDGVRAMTQLNEPAVEEAAPAMILLSSVCTYIFATVI